MLATQLRSGLTVLAKEAAVDLQVVWRKVNAAELAASALHDILPALVAAYGAGAATLAADLYDEQRDQLEVKGRFRAIPADIPDSGAHALVGWALTEAADLTSFQTLILGGTQRRIANFARDTITGSSLADPGATGWQREGSGECEFCDMLIGRGAVYSEATADFGAHDHCQCVAVPAFEGHPKPVKGYTPTDRNITDADRERVREWIAANGE